MTCRRHPTVAEEKSWCMDCFPEKYAVAQPTSGMVESPAQADTSAEAARQIAHLTGRGRLLVLREIVATGGCTDEEGILLTGLSSSTWRPRRVELHKGWKNFDGGFIFDSGERRQTKAKRPAIVWRATAKGRAVLEAVV